MKMNDILCLFFVLLSTSLAIVSAEECPRETEMNLIMGILCNNTITDEQCANIMTNCNCDKRKECEDIIKGCLKKDTLTDRERLTAICNSTVNECFHKEFDKNPPDTEEKKKESLNNLKQFKDCIKQQLGMSKK